MLPGALAADLRYSLKTLRGAPLVSAMAVVTLGLGIGAATAVLSVVANVVLRPLPYPDADRLMQVPGSVVPGGSREVSWLNYEDWRREASPFIDLAAYAESDATFGWEGGAESLRGALVTANFFDVIGVAPALGRAFSVDEDTHGGPDAVILSHALWQSRFGGDPAVVNTTVPLDDARVPVVGVMPAGFAAPFAGLDYWAPMQGEELMERVGLPTGTRSLSFALVLGRLNDAVPLDSAQSRLQALAARVAADAGVPDDRRDVPALVPMLEDLVGGVRSMLYLILAAAGLVLLVAAMNVAGLAFSRATAREREIALRTALGAPRGRIIGQLLTESALLSLAAGALGIAVARALQVLLIRLAPTSVPRLDTVGLDAVTLAFAATATLASGLLFGGVPSILSARAPLLRGLTGGRGASASRSSLRPQRWLVSLQVAVSVVLLTGAALLMNSFARLMSVDLGFDHSQVILAMVEPGDSRYPTATEIDRFYARLLETVRAMPGVSAASTTFSPPLVGNDFRTTVVPEAVTDRDQRVWAGSVVVRDDYFESAGIPLLMGRAFDGSERLGQPPVAIVNQAMAARLWPGQDPLGKRFEFAGGLSGSAGSFDSEFFPREPYTVIGVAGDVRRTELAQPPAPEYYRPHQQIAWRLQYLVVRTTRTAADMSGRLREAVWSIDPAVPVRTVRTQASHVDEAAAAPRFRLALLSVFAALTSLLAMVGLYAVTALAVARRTREMGICLALGASRARVVRGVLAGGLRLVLTGAAIGLPAAWFASQWLSAMLFELEPTDPATYLAVVGATVAVAVLASYGPARRAGRVDPTRVLQAE
jgi:predicted permease